MENHKLLEKVNSLMIAFTLVSGFIARMVAALTGLEIGVTPFVTVLALIVSYTTLLLTKPRIEFEKNSLFFIYFIVLAFLISILFRGVESFSSVYFIEFIIYGVITYLLFILKFSPSLVIYFTMLLGNIILINPIAFKNYISIGETYDFVSMDATYAILPCIVATIIYFLFQKKKGNLLLNVISLISNAYLFYIVVFEGSRGAVLAILLLFVLIAYILLTNKMKKNLGLGSIFSFFIALIFITITIIVTNIQVFLVWLDNLLLSYNIEVAAITKTMNMIERSGLIGILNARDWYYQRAIELFTESPFFGHGIGVFGDLFEGRYPHNLFLQLMIEGGLLFLIPFVGIISIILWMLIKPWTKTDIFYEKKLFILFLFIICMPRLAFSSYLWRQQAFWLMIFFIFSILSIRKSTFNFDLFQRKNNIVINENSK